MVSAEITALKAENFAIHPPSGGIPASGAMKIVISVARTGE